MVRRGYTVSGYGSIWVHVGPYGSIWVHMGPRGSMWVYVGPSIWVHVVHVPCGGPVEKFLICAYGTGEHTYTHIHTLIDIHTYCTQIAFIQVQTHTHM